MNIRIQGVLDNKQSKALLAGLTYVNAALHETDKLTAEKLLWRVITSELTRMADRGHNRIVEVVTDYRDPQKVWERKDGKRG